MKALRRNDVTVIDPTALVAKCSAVEPPPPVEDVEKVFPFLTLTSSSLSSFTYSDHDTNVLEPFSTVCE